MFIKMLNFYRVKSPIDDRLMDGVSSMRVHASFNYSNSNYAIRLTDIYVIKVCLLFRLILFKNNV